MLTECFGDRCLVESNKTVGLGSREFISFSLRAGGSTDVAYIDSAGVFSSENTGPGGRANRACGIRIREKSPVFGHLVDHGSFIKCTSVDSNVGPPQIIDQEKNNIGL